MALDKKSVEPVVEKIKDFFKDLLKPNMTLEKIAEVASPRLDEIISKNEEKGLKYSAGKFNVKCLDDEHFGLEFEMYFKDSEGKWYTTGNESEPRKAELLDPKVWQTLQSLKVITFPIENSKEEKVAEPAKLDAPKE